MNNSLIVLINISFIDNLVGTISKWNYGVNYISSTDITEEDEQQKRSSFDILVFQYLTFFIDQRRLALYTVFYNENYYSIENENVSLH